jgi:hypothetical protein
MFLFFLSLILYASSELINYEIMVDHPNFFDKHFVVMTKNNANEKIFGYSPTEACYATLNRNHLGVYIQNVQTLEKSAEILFEIPVDQAHISIISCFKHKDSSYIIFKRHDTEETVFIQGQNNAKTFRNLNYDRILFDHLENKLYMTKNSLLYNIETNYLDSIWTKTAQTRFGVLPINYITKYENSTDLLIIADHLYFIKDHKVLQKLIIIYM